MNTESLEIFCWVASELSITQAAARLGRAPSNVTTRIQQLEADIGAELFVRTNKRMALTSAGEQFLGYARRFLALEQEARHVVSGGRDGGTLRLGSMESTAASRLPTLLVDYHERHSATRLTISTGPTRPLLEQVRTGQLDCAFVALSPLVGRSHSLLDDLGLVAVPAWRETLKLLLPAGEDATDVAKIRVRRLAAFPQGCTYRGIAEEALGIPAAADWQVTERCSYHAMIASVAAGGCVTILPESVLRLSALPTRLRTLDVGEIETALVARQGFAVPAYAALTELLHEHCR